MIVPWVNAWSSELGYWAAPDPLLGGRLALHQTDAPGGGRPLLKFQHFNRARAAMIHGLCGVCAKPLAGDAWHFADFLTPAGGGWLEVHEAALHRDCAELASRLCPRLVEGRVTLCPIDWPPRLFPTLGQPGEVARHYEMDVTPEGPVILALTMHVRLRLPA
jgi:hypothetical protein